MSKLNMAQLPVVEEYLSAFESSPGHSIVYVDFSAQEPHVLTEFSQDKRMLDVYGENAQPNDIYIYFGAYTSLFGKEIRQYYDPENPTKESVARAKKECAAIRQVLKIMVLGMGYGMFPNKLKEGVNLAGFKISKAEATHIFNDYWNFFRGVKNFEERLLESYHQNNGYIVNGRGRPLAIHPDYTKDIVNRFVQSTAHDVTMRYIYILQQEREKKSIPMRPWMVDEHDATVWETPDRYVPQVVEVFNNAMTTLNNTLGWGIKFKGSVKTGKSLAIKCE